MTGKIGKIPPIAIAIAISAVGSLPVFLVGSLSMEEGQTLHTGAGTIALLIALFFATAAIGASVLGHFADRVGSVKMMRVGAFGTGVGALILSGSGFPLLFAAGVGIAGLSYGACQPAVSRYLAENVKVTQHGIAFGLRQTGVPIATLLSGVAVSITSANGEWQLAFFAGATLAFCILFLLVVSSNAPAPYQRKIHSSEIGKAEVRWPLLALLGGSLGLGAGTIYVIASFAVPSARSIGISAVYAGVLGATGGALALFSRVLAGFLADRLRFEPLRIAGFMLICGATGYLLISSEIKYLAIVGILLAFSVGSGWNALYLLSLARDFPGNSGKATGVGLAGAYVGGVAGPLIFGYVLSHHGLSLAWIVEGATAMLAGVGALIGWMSLRKLIVLNSQ